MSLILTTTPIRGRGVCARRMQENPALRLGDLTKVTQGLNAETGVCTQMESNSELTSTPLTKSRLNPATVVVACSPKVASLEDTAHVSILGCMERLTAFKRCLLPIKPQTVMVGNHPWEKVVGQKWKSGRGIKFGIMEPRGMLRIRQMELWESKQ